MAKKSGSVRNLREKAEDRLRELSTRILSNLIMLGQIPAPSGDEGDRCQYLMDRFTALGLEDVGKDDSGNIYARRPGTVGKRTLGLFAGIDTVCSQEIEHNLDVTPSRVIGPGVAYDSLAASALVSVAEFLDEWDVPLEDDILFIGLARCADQADQEGMRDFLDGSTRRPDLALMLESITLGRLSYFSFGCLKFDLSIELQEGEWPEGGMGHSSAINVMADAVNLLLAIELPRRPKSVVNLGMIQGGDGHGNWASKASLAAEIRSESAETLARLEDEVNEIAGHLASYYSCHVDLHRFGRRVNAGLRFNHPMVRTLRSLMKELEITVSPGPDTTAGSLAMAAGIPTVTLGLTRGKRLGRESFIEIDPIHKGLLQVILALHRLGELPR